MLAFIKKDFLINSWVSYISFALFMIGTYYIGLSPYFMFIVGFFSFSFYVYFYDEKNDVNRFLSSIPVPRKVIVQSRYVYCMLINSFLILFQWGFMTLLSPLLTENHYVYNWRDMIVLFSIGSIIIAISIPIINRFRSIYYGVGIIFALFAIGTFKIMDELINVLNMNDVIDFNKLDAGYVLLVEKYFPFQPYVTLLIFIGVLLYLSMKISIHKFQKKDF